MVRSGGAFMFVGVANWPGYDLDEIVWVMFFFSGGYGIGL